MLNPRSVQPSHGPVCAVPYPRLAWRAIQRQSDDVLRVPEVSAHGRPYVDFLESVFVCVLAHCEARQACLGSLILGRTTVNPALHYPE